MKSVTNLINKLIDYFKNKSALSPYKMMSVQNRYPCMLIGEKHLYDCKTTIIQYVVKSKRDVVYEINIDELLNDPLLIEKFHPTQAVKIGCIAMGNILYSTPETEIKQKYEHIMENMLNTSEN